MPKHRAHGEGTVTFWKEKGLWVAKITLPDGKRKTKYGKTQREVKEWLLEARKQLADGMLISNEKLTVTQFLDRWFEDVAKPKLRQSTITTDECMIRLHIKPALGHLLLTQLTPVHLQNLYAEKLKSGLSKRTVKYIHTIMHQMLDQALKWNLVPRKAR